MHHKPINPARNQRDRGKKEGWKQEEMVILGQMEFTKEKI